ncbi:MAG: glycosyltransferase, partial [Angustibacter sp.]
RILYMGSATHSADLEMIRPAIERLPKNGLVGLDVVGVSTGSDDWFRRIDIPEGRTHYPEFVSWLRRRRHEWSLGVAPLTPDPFNSAKSDLKFLEYSMLGLATIASDSEPYAELRDVGATLVSSNPDSWHDAISSLVGDPHERRRRARMARTYSLGERTVGTDGWINVVLE